VNKILTLITLILFLTSCQKTVSGTAAPVDLAKVEQLKKVLAEQANPLASPEAPTSSNNNSVDSTNVPVIRSYPASISLIEGLSTTFSVLYQQPNGVEKSLSENLIFDAQPAGIVTVNTVAANSLFTVTARTPGRTFITIKSGTMTTTLDVVVKAKELVSVEIFPKSTAIGTPSRFVLSGVYNNGTRSEITSGVNWESIDTSYLQSNAQSASSGVFTGAKVGLSGLRAVYGSMTVVARIDIRMPTIQKIDVVAEADTFLLGAIDVQVSAIATFAGGNTFDIASSVTWIVEDPSILSVSSIGRLEALFPGETLVKAKFGAVSGESSFFVTSETFASFRISPTTASTPVGLPAQFKFYGVRADNTERDITIYSRWTVADSNIAYSGTTLSPRQPGNIFGVNKGSTTVTARYGINSLPAQVTITDPVVLSLNMTGEKLEGICGVDEPKLKVEGLLSDGSTKDITSLVTFLVEPTSLGIPRTEPAKLGSIVTKTKGDGKVTASYYEASTSTLLTAAKNLKVKDPIQLGTGITAESTSVPFGTQLIMHSGQVMSCGVGTDYTATSTWLTDNSASIVNTIINHADSKGILSTLDMGDAPTTSNKTIKVMTTKGTLASELEITVRPKEVIRVATVAMLTQPSADDPLVNETIEVDFLDVGSVAQLVSTSTFSNNEETPIPNSDGLYSDHTVQYGIVDCTATGCATIDPVTGVITAGSKEGYVKVYSIVTPPPPQLPIESPKASIAIRSRCATALGGVRSGLYCVRFGVKGQSCDQTCKAVTKGSLIGAYHDATAKIFGHDALQSTQCNAALMALSWTPGLQVTSPHNSTVGVGCALWNITSISQRRSVRDSINVTTAEAFHPDYERVCACTEPP
jgi:hypothetical protein